MTNTERATLYSTLADAIGQQEAEILMEQLPPSGWDQVATKDDLNVLGASFTAGLAETNAAITAGLAETNAAITAGLAEANAAITAGLAEANAAITAGLAEANAAMKAGFAEAAKERAEIIRSQARQLYIITATIIAATVSIWFALYTGPGAG